MYSELQNNKKIDLFISLNIDSLSSYLTPILAQYNIQYNEFINKFFEEYRKFLGEMASVICIDNLVESQPLSKYNLRIRIQLILLEFNLNEVVKYQLVFKPLILNHILLYYFKNRYRKKVRLDFLNVIKLGLFFWWNINYNLLQFSKNNYQFLRWYIILKTYSFKNYGPRFKNASYEFFANQYLKQSIDNKKDYWCFNYNYYIKYKYILFCHYLYSINQKFIIFNTNLKFLRNDIASLRKYGIDFIKFQQRTHNIVIFSQNRDFDLWNDLTTRDIILVIRHKKIYNWSFLSLSMQTDLISTYNFLIFLIQSLYIYLNFINFNLYAYNKFINLS